MGFEYNDEYYTPTEGIETALKIVDSIEEAELLIRSLTLAAIREGDTDELDQGERYGDDDEWIAEKDWTVMSDDQVLDFLRDNDLALYRALPITTP